MRTSSPLSASHSDSTSPPTHRCNTNKDTSHSHDPQFRSRSDLESTLDALTHAAQSIVEQQPRSTQLALARQTHDIFAAYAEHGSQVRLAARVMQFLRERDSDGEKRDGRLRMRYVTAEVVGGEGEGKEEMKIETKAGWEPSEVDHGGLDEMQSCPLQQYHHHDHHRQPRGMPAQTSSTPTSRPLHINDLESTSLVTSLPFNPLDTIIEFDPHLHWPHDLLTHLNHIFALHTHHARLLLHHHVSKYGPSPVFRAGIAEHLHSHFSWPFASTTSTDPSDLNLTPETRTFFRAVYDAHPDLNVAERRLLGRVARVPEDAVTMFWDDIRMRQRAWWAMRCYVAARELERNRRAKREGRW